MFASVRVGLREGPPARLTFDTDSLATPVVCASASAFMTEGVAFFPLVSRCGGFFVLPEA